MEFIFFHKQTCSNGYHIFTKDGSAVPIKGGTKCDLCWRRLYSGVHNASLRDIAREEDSPTWSYTKHGKSYLQCFSAYLYTFTLVIIMTMCAART